MLLLGHNISIKDTNNGLYKPNRWYILNAEISHTRRLCWMSTNFPPLGTVKTVKQTWIQRFPAEEQKWSAAMSPETHAVNLRHDNSNSGNSKRFKKPVHQPKDAEASTTSQSAEEQSSSWEEPISLSAAVLLPRWAHDAERAEAGQEKHAPLLVQQRQPGCLLEEARTRSWAKTHIYGYGGSEAERGKEGGERVWTWLTDHGNGWRTCVKSLFGVFKDRICACAVLRFRIQQLAFKIPARKGIVLLLSGFLSLDQTQLFFSPIDH